MYRKNTAGQYIYFAMVNATTGAALTGATVTGKRGIDGAAQASVTGTITEDAGGQYHLAMSQADTNGNDIGFLFTATNAIPVNLSIVTTAADPTDAVHFGLSALPNTACTTNASLLTSGTSTDQISVTSGRVDVGKALGTAVTLDSNNVLNVSAKYLAGTALTARDIGASVLLAAGTGTGQLDFTSGVVKANATQWLGGTIPAVNVTGVPLVDLKYTLGTISPAAAGYVGVDWAQLTNKTATNVLSGTTVGTVTALTGTVTLAAAGLDNVVVESGINARQALSLIGAAAAGVLSGAVTSTVLIAGLNVATNRISASVDGSGNRTAVTLSPPA